MSKKILNGKLSIDTSYLNLTTISGKVGIKAIKSAKIRLIDETCENKEKLVTIGLTNKVLKSELILHPELIK